MRTNREAVGLRRLPHCGCFVMIDSRRRYLPNLSVEAHTTILSTTSRTTLTQTFINPRLTKPLDELRYTFPLYDGVSVVGFTCTIGNRVIKGVVRERQKAKQDFEAAKDRGEQAGLLEQSLHAADIFMTTLGNVPAGEKVKVEITYVGELKHDAEVDGLRFTIPTSIAPRFTEREKMETDSIDSPGGTISITVDAQMPSGSAIASIQSPSHPISVSIGTLSTAPSTEPSLHKASAKLALQVSELGKDFVVQVMATHLGDPSAVLETHPTIPNRRALMATLVPKFNLPAEKPEIVFVCDRSGSMGQGKKIPNVIAALELFLKSLPVGVKFNLCSFGNSYSFLWEKSQTYSQETVDEAVKHVQGFDSSMGGTRMYKPMEETFERRWKDMNLEVFLLTDGEILAQDELFSLINKNVANSKGSIRVFTLGVGEDASHALIEGVARAGNGFAQIVGKDEKMDNKLIRMLKGAVTPHVTDYTLDIKYDKADAEEDFELVDKVMDGLDLTDVTAITSDEPKNPISLFDASTESKDTEIADTGSVETKYDHLPPVAEPRYLQAPSQIPPLFPFSRTSVYVLLSGSAPDRKPTSVLLRATSKHGPLELEIPVATLAERGTTIHQLAARKAVKELEEGRGWLASAKAPSGKLLKKEHEGRFSDMVEREAVRLGVKYQVGGKWCSFVAIQESDADGNVADEELDEFEVITSQHAQPRARMQMKAMARTVDRSGGGARQYRMAALPAPAPARVSRRVDTSNFDPEFASSAPAPMDSFTESATLSADVMAQFAGFDYKRPNLNPSQNELQTLVSLQTFIGAWSWTAELEGVLGITMEKAEEAVQDPGVKGNDMARSALATACAVAFLKKRLPADKEAWEMMVEKAERWLELQPVSVEAVEKAAQALF